MVKVIRPASASVVADTAATIVDSALQTASVQKRDSSSGPVVSAATESGPKLRYEYDRMALPLVHVYDAESEWEIGFEALVQVAVADRVRKLGVPVVMAPILRRTPELNGNLPAMLRADGCSKETSRGCFWICRHNGEMLLLMIFFGAGGVRSMAQYMDIAPSTVMAKITAMVIDAAMQK